MSESPELEELRAPVGEVRVELTESPTTGYRWSLAEHPPEVTPVESRFERTTSRRVMGGSGTRVFSFRIDQPGAFTLRFELKREWEQQAVDARVVRVITER
jgi:predicted secreted protein